MRIAFITFEFPPAVAIGGIGTYALEAVRMLTDRGHDVEVFSAGSRSLPESSGVPVHRVDVGDREAFRTGVLPVFLSRHRERAFEVVESPEIGAEALEISREVPGVARVVKLHTPTFLVQEIGVEPPSMGEQLRFSFGALRRGRLARLKRAPYLREEDPEFRFTHTAHEVAAPSRAIAERLINEWSLDAERLTIFPHPIHPRTDLQALQVPSKVNSIGFLGRLEPRKGIQALVAAIPSILRQAPDLKFRFIGPSWPYRGGDMVSWMKSRLRREAPALNFRGGIPPDRLGEELAACDAMVLPSRWENFPMACMESMLAGRAVIGSYSGGMSELIEEGGSGLLVPPDAPGEIARAVLALVADPSLAERVASGARHRVLTWLSPDRIAPLHIASYERAIQRAGRG